MSKTIGRVSTTWLLAAVLTAGISHGAPTRAVEAVSVHLKLVPSTDSEPRLVVLAAPAHLPVIQNAYTTMLDWVHGTLTRMRGGFLRARSLFWTLIGRAQL